MVNSNDERLHPMKSDAVYECPTCGKETRWSSLYKKWGYTIYRCSQCSLGRTRVDDTYSAADIYDESYFSGGRRDGYADYLKSEPVLRSEFRRTVEHLRLRGPQSGRLLEIGCAFGFFLLEAQPYFECIGFEISEIAAASCRAKGLNVFSAEIAADLVKAHGFYEVVVMLDVIEHLERPSEIVDSIYQSLNPGGWLLLTTGDWGSPLARAMGKNWRLITPPQHLFFFSSRTLPQLLERIGFRIVECAHPWKMVPLALAAYQFGRRAGLGIPLLESATRGVPVNLFDTIRVIARKE